MSLTKLTKKLGMLILAGLPFFNSGCIETYETKLEAKLKEKGFTQEQAEVGVVMGERMLFMNEKKNVKEEDGTSSYEYSFNYGGIKIDDAKEKVDEIVQDLEEILSHKNRIQDEKFLDSFKLRDSCEKQLKVFKYLQDTLGLQQLFNVFNDYMGSRQQLPNSDPHFVRPDEAYSLGALLPKSQKDEFVFDAKYVQDARNAGKFSDKFIVEVAERKIKFFEKVQNPNYPLKDKNKEFIFKEREQQIRVISYCFDDNEQKQANYIEAYRINEAGVQESLPAIKVFRPLTAQNLHILVIDKDKQTDKKGYGKPDKIDWRSDIYKGSDILQSQDLVDSIFKIDEKPPIQNPNTSQKDVHIIETGKNYFAEYEISKDGWERFLPDYTNQSNSFRLHIKYIDLSAQEIKESHELQKKGALPKPRKIEWIAKAYSGWERIVEFYRPSDMVKDKEIVRINIMNNKEIEIFEKGKPAQKFTLEDTLTQRPYEIDFDYSDQKRWRIKDKDNCGKHYEAKQEIRKPDDLRLPPIQK